MYHYRYNPSSITRKLTEENIKNNIITATKCYYKVYKTIDDLQIKNKAEYKKAVLIRLIDEICKWQIDLIGILDNKEQSVSYLKWYYFDYEHVKKIKSEIEKISIKPDELKYKMFYKTIFKNINLAYYIGFSTYKLKLIYRFIKRKLKRDLI